MSVSKVRFSYRKSQGPPKQEYDTIEMHRVSIKGFEV